MAGGPGEIDAALRQLLEQQADIQTRISLLLAAQNGFDPSHELRMLLHKCRVLENFVHDNGEFSQVFFCPLPSSFGLAQAMRSMM